MDRRYSDGEFSQKERRQRTISQGQAPIKDPYDDYTRRQASRPTVRQVPDRKHSRTRSSRYATRDGISDEKLDNLNRQLGWSSEDATRTSRSSHDLDLRKQRRRLSDKHESRPVRRQPDRHLSASSQQASEEPKVLPKAHAARRISNRRDVSDDFYYREKTQHRRVASGQPLISTRKSKTRKRSLQHRKSHRRRSRDIEKAAKSKNTQRKKGMIACAILIVLIALIIGIVIGVTKHIDDGHTQSPAAANASLNAVSSDSIPSDAKGTYMDPFTWYDTTDFNLTWTNSTIGDLPVMGLNSSFSNNIAANPTVPSLNQPWPYGTRPIRGINIGGWLSLEPFITPSIFDATVPTDVRSSTRPPYPDEWTLCSALGPQAANILLDKHYSTFANFSTFAAIRAAGFDHVRIPFPYWSVQTYPDDPYVPNTSWRYLLRGIEYARQNGLRVNLDLHSAPGSQNGWNHSGREGSIGWLNGTDGQLNAQRTLEIHARLAEFFAQERYRGLITIYGILNEPRMTFMNPPDAVNWTAAAVRQLRSSPLPKDTVLALSDGFMSLPYWRTAFASEDYSDIIPAGSNAAAEKLLLDSHEYVIFNRDQLLLNHTSKLDFACNGWSQQASSSMDPTTGFGSFVCGEWSQADTDCAAHLNPEGVGNRWEGTLKTNNVTTSVLVPSCPLVNEGRGGDCKCEQANASPGEWSDGYKTWLRRFADAQLRSFQKGWGSFYWTWDVEDGVEGGSMWSWKKGVEAGILPRDVSERGDQLYNCMGKEDWEKMGLEEGW